MKKLIFCFFFWLISISTSCYAGGLKSFFQLSRYEKWWVISHPFIAHRAYLITLEAREETQKVLADSLYDHDAFGGQVDAFRHTYWMARLAQEMKWKKALRLGAAHEKANYLSFKKNKFDEEGLLPDSASGAMDLFNNKIGVSIGCNFKSASKDSLKAEISKAIYTGKLLIIQKDKFGKSVNCSGEIINDVKLLRKWNIPKCLVPSNFRK